MSRTKDRLFGIPTIPWIQSAAQRMEEASRDDRLYWNKQWVSEYARLGGESASSGTKPCPRAAAYALWYLGYLAGTKRPRLNWAIGRVYSELGKNAAYVVIGFGMLEKGSAADARELWKNVRKRFQDDLGVEPSASEQGEIRLVIEVYAEHDR